MYPDSRQRITELLDVARYLEDPAEGYTGTASWVRTFAKHLAARKPVADLKGDFEDLVNTFQSEFRRDDAVRGLLIKIIGGIVFAALKSKRIREKLLEFRPLFEEVNANSKNIGFIITPFLPYRKQRDYKMQYYGMCLHYLFHAEGIFDATLQIIYALASVAMDRPLALREVSSMRLRDLRQGFHDDLKLPGDIFFLGWEDGRIRNAIAHLRFSYDNASQKMRFRDIETGQRGPYDKSFTVKGFSELSLRLMDPWHLVHHLFIILRMQQLVFNPKVDPPPGKYLIFR